MDTVYSADSETEAESGLLSEDDAGSSSDPEVAELTKRLRRDSEEKKKGRFSCFPTANTSSDAPSRQVYRVYKWRWLMLITLFLLNVSNGAVSKPPSV